MSIRHRIQSRLSSLKTRVPFLNHGPVRLTIRWDDFELPNSIGFGKRKSLPEFQGLIAEYVQQSGPCMVRVVAGNAGADPDVAEILRFAHRVGCPTELVISGITLDTESLSRIFLSGVDTILLPIGGVSSKVHDVVVGIPISESTETLQQLLRMKSGTNTSIVVLLPWVGDTPLEANAIREWTRELGVDQVQIQVPYKGRDMSDETIPHHPHLSKMLLSVLRDAQDAPGWKRHQPWSCPVGQQRLEISKVGRVCACPFKQPVMWNREALTDLWDRLEPHRKEISNCDRICLHRELRFS